MVLSKDPADKKALPSLWKQAGNFAKAIAGHVADGLKTVDAGTLEARLAACAVCHLRNDDRCAECGCLLAEKTKWRSSACPIGTWQAAPAEVGETRDAA